MVPTLHRLEGGGRRLAVTIDDGPNPDTTEAILDALEAFDAKANFFACGINAEMYPGLCRGIVAAGHGLFSHGFDHPAFDRLDQSAIIDQLERTELRLGRFRPAPSPYPIRLPYGAGWDLDKVQKAVEEWRGDAVFVQWSHCVEEWIFIADCRTPGEIHQACSARVAALEGDWDGGIVLLHDWPASPAGGGQRRPLTPAFCAGLLEQYLLEVRNRGLETALLSPSCQILNRDQAASNLFRAHCD